ncbi:hypothetical protein AMECASPLE_037213 [Ameca splendens]|uniref:Uncharacterized protein n=1 Tax=Ameca splendens TaxID=208324 RepID=A0ABV0YK62_9TELE
MRSLLSSFQTGLGVIETVSLQGILCKQFAFCRSQREKSSNACILITPFINEYRVHTVIHSYLTCAYDPVILSHPWIQFEEFMSVCLQRDISALCLSVQAPG